MTPPPNRQISTDVFTVEYLKFKSLWFSGRANDEINWKMRNGTWLIRLKAINLFIHLQLRERNEPIEAHIENQVVSLLVVLNVDNHIILVAGVIVLDRSDQRFPLKNVFIWFVGSASFWLTIRMLNLSHHVNQKNNNQKYGKHVHRQHWKTNLI